MKYFINKIYKVITHRLFILSIFFLAMYFVLFSRLFNLQIVNGEKYQNEFSASIRRTVPFEGSRGTIYDRNGIALAKNDFAFSVLLDERIDIKNKNEILFELITMIEKNGDKINYDFPIRYSEDEGFYFSSSISRVNRLKVDILGNSIESFTDKQKNINVNDMIDQVMEYFKIDNNYENDKKIKIASIRYQMLQQGYKKYVPIKIAINVSEETVTEIKEKNFKFPGVSVEVEPIRKYPYSNVFAHIIGYTGGISDQQLKEFKNYNYDQLDIVGITGLEKSMELKLKAEDGLKSIEVDSSGKTMNVLDITAPQNGSDIYLTIDKDFQVDVYNLIQKKLTDILLSRIVVNEPNTVSKSIKISLNKIFEALINNNLISISNIENSTNEYGVKLKITYEEKANIINRKFESLLLNDNVTINNFSDFYKDIYDSFIQKLINESKIKTTYREDTEFYPKYKLGNITPKNFFEYCLENGIFFADETSPYDNKESLIRDKITNELIEFFSTNQIKKKIYSYVINNGYVSHRNLLLIMIEQGLITNNDDIFNQLIENKIKPIDVIKHKISIGEITPQNLVLDPYSASVVVTDIKTGEVLAMASYPSFDNNKLVNGLDYNYYNKLLQDKSNPLYQRAIKERRAPGSTFKIITALAALEEQIISGDEKIYTKGIFEKIVWPHPSCWIYGSYHTNHGKINIVDALAVSCNYFFFEVAYRMSLNTNGEFVDSQGITMIDEYAKKFGLGEKSGIELDEYNPEISTNDAVRTAIGQGGNNYTPVQLAKFISTLANNGIGYNLHLIDRIIDKYGVIDKKQNTISNTTNFNELNLQIVKEGLLKVTAGNNGTASAVFKDFPVGVAGKTGTAQENIKRADHASFVGYAPYEEPLIGISVVIPNGHTSNYAAELFRDVVASYFELYKQREEVTLDNYFLQ